MVQSLSPNTAETRAIASLWRRWRLSIGASSARPQQATLILPVPSTSSNLTLHLRILSPQYISCLTWGKLYISYTWIILCAIAKKYSAIRQHLKNETYTVDPEWRVSTPSIFLFSGIIGRAISPIEYTIWTLRRYALPTFVPHHIYPLRL